MSNSVRGDGRRVEKSLAQIVPFAWQTLTEAIGEEFELVDRSLQALFDGAGIEPRLDGRLLPKPMRCGYSGAPPPQRIGVSLRSFRGPLRKKMRSATLDILMRSHWLSPLAPSALEFCSSEL